MYMWQFILFAPITLSLYDKPQLDILVDDSHMGRLIQAELARDWTQWEQTGELAGISLWLKLNANVKVIYYLDPGAPPFEGCWFRVASSKYSRSWRPVPVQAARCSTFPIKWVQTEVEKWLYHWKLMAYERALNNYWMSFGYGGPPDDPEPIKPETPQYPWKKDYESRNDTGGSAADSTAGAKADGDD